MVGSDDQRSGAKLDEDETERRGPMTLFIRLISLQDRDSVVLCATRVIKRVYFYDT